jgi:hypothetical protein
MLKYRAILLGIGLFSGTWVASNAVSAFTTEARVPAIAAAGFSESALLEQAPKSIAQTVAENREKLDRIRLMLREYSLLGPTSTLVRRDNNQQDVVWFTSARPPERVTTKYACSDLILHEPTSQYGLKWEGMPSKPTDRCEGFHASHGYVPTDGWMLGWRGQGEIHNGCVVKLVELCRVSERQFLQILLTDFLSTVQNMFDVQLRLDAAVVAAKGVSNRDQARVTSSVAANRKRLDDAHKLLADSSRLQDHQYFSRVMSEHVEALVAIVDDQALLDRELARIK